MVFSVLFMRCIQTDWSPQGLSHDCIWHSTENRLHEKEDEEVNRNGGGMCQVDDKCQKWEGQDPGDCFYCLWKYSFSSAYGKWTGKTFWEKTKKKLPSPPLGQSPYTVHERLPLLVYHISSSVRVGAFGAGLGSFFIYRLYILVLSIRCFLHTVYPASLVIFTSVLCLIHLVSLRLS